MDALFTVQNLFTLLMLIALQAVLGFDNLLYVSLESKRVPAEKQAYVRKMGVGLAILFRLVLLFVIMSAIEYVQDPLFKISVPGIIEGEFNGHALIVFFGGAFIIYTAMKEIHHLLSVDHLEAHEGGKRSVSSALFWIILMNVIFSFDSILSAMALTDVFLVMATAIVISGVIMVLLADHVAEFLQKNRMYEVLGLFILFIVGIMLVSEGGHLTHLKLFGYPIEAMS
ncbi:MAG: TerC family protein, partial [Alphaproteobacteria bacterium]